MFHEQLLVKAARYRHTAEYIEDAAFTPYLLRMAEDFERQAFQESAVAATSPMRPQICLDAPQAMAECAKDH